MTKKRTVEFFLTPGSVGLDLVGPLDVLAGVEVVLKRSGIEDSGYHIVYSALEPGIVEFNAGLRLVADVAIGESPAPDIFVLPGGMRTHEHITDSVMLEKIAYQGKRAKRIATVCRGAYLAAASGLLDGKRATTHWIDTDHFCKTFPQVNVEPDAIYIKDGNVWSSAGITAGIDLALAMVEEDFGSEVAMNIAKLLVLYRYRTGNQSQYSLPIQLRAKAGDRFAKLHDWILQNLSLTLTVEQLAEFMSMSPRNFSRMFSQETGMAPGQYVEMMRVNYARELLESSNVSMAEIAQACGLIREERLRRAFLRHFDTTPTQYRAHFCSPSNNA